MSRSLRIQYPGAIYHVTVRGNGRQAIVADDADRRLFYSRMEARVEHAAFVGSGIIAERMAMRLKAMGQPNYDKCRLCSIHDAKHDEGNEIDGCSGSNRS